MVPPWKTETVTYIPPTWKAFHDDHPASYGYVVYQTGGSAGVWMVPNDRSPEVGLWHLWPVRKSDQIINTAVVV